MRLLGSKTEKSHFYYFLIYQVFKPHFSSKNETLILFFEKKTFSRRQPMPVKFSRRQSMPIKLEDYSMMIPPLG